MTAEETELTFIRCPNCRSLIPAIASRCRMCGHQFEKAGNNAQPPAPDDAQQKSRVRQRTGSASATEVDAIKTQSGSGTHSVSGSSSSNPVPAPNNAFASSNQSAATSKFSTPQPTQEELGNKLSSWKQFVSTGAPIADEDIDTTFLDEEPKKEKERLPTGVLSREKLLADSSFESDADIVDAFAWDDADENEEDEDFEGEADAEGDALSSADAAPQGRKRRRRRRRRKGNAANDQAVGGSPAVPQAAAPEAVSPQSASEIPSPVKETSSSAQSSSTPFMVRSAFASSAPAEPPKSEAKAPAPASAVPSVESPPLPPAAPAVSTSGSSLNTDVPAASASTTPPTKSFVAQPQVSVPVVSESSPSSAQPVVKSENSESPKSTGPRVEAPRPEAPRMAPNHVMGEGMLVGWLVTFKEDQKGKAIEIREGRRFIGRGHLRASDVVFEHESVSTPHGMLAASQSDGLMFQDLMSEKGTYILRAGGKVSDWSQVVNSVVVQHGDRLRFGDYEVLVVLLPR